MAKVAEATVRLSLEDKVTGSLKRIKAQFASISKGLGINRITASTKNLTKSLTNLNKGFGQSMGRIGKLTALLGLGGGGLAASMYGLSKNTAQMAMELGDVSKQLGIGVVDLQLWRHAAERSGVGAAKFDSALAQLNKKSAEAAKGNKASAAAFKELGISVKDSSGKLKSGNQLMQEVTASMGKISSQSVRQRLASVLLGGDGREMAAMLGQGMEPISELFEEARNEGWVIGQDVVDAGADLMTNLGGLQGHLKGIKTFLSVHLMPVVNDVIKAVRDWIAENKQLIQSGIAEWCGKLRQVIKDLQNPASDLRKRIDGLVKGFKSFYEKISPIVDFLGGPLLVGLGALAIFIAGPMLAALYSLTSAVVSLGIALLTTPVGWILLGLIALGAAVYVLYQRWDEFKAYWLDFWGRITRAFDKGFIQGITTLLLEFNPLTHIVRGIDAIFEYFTGISLLDAGARLIDSLNDGVIWAFEGIWNFFANIGNNIWGAVVSTDATLKDIGLSVINMVWEGLKAGWEHVKKWFRDAVDNLTGFVPDWVKEQLGFKVNVQAATEGLESVQSTVTHSVEALAAARPAIPNFTKSSEMDHIKARLEQIDRENGRGGGAQSIEAAQMDVGQLDIPEPLLVHKPNQIDASVTIQNLTIQSSGTPSDIQAALNRALATHAANQQRSITSSLTD